MVIFGRVVSRLSWESSCSCGKAKAVAHLLSGGGSAAKAFTEPGWMKMKLRKEGTMRKVFILGERTKTKLRFLGRESGTRRDIHFRQRNDNCGLNQAITNQSIISRLSRTPVRTPAFAMHQLGSRFYNVSAISCGRELR